MTNAKAGESYPRVTVSYAGAAVSCPPTDKVRSWTGERCALKATKANCEGQMQVKSRKIKAWCWSSPLTADDAASTGVILDEIGEPPGRIQSAIR